jgi:hypothetical protein
MEKESYLVEIIHIAKKEIPSVDDIIEITLNNLQLEKEFVYKQFGTALNLIDEKGTDVYLNYEKKALYKLAEQWVELQKEDIKKELKDILMKKDWEEFVKSVSKVFTEFGILVQKFEKDLGNMRKARGGITFQKAVLRLLNFIDIQGEMPYGNVGERLGRIDIVLPSSKIALENPSKAIFITCKRTLRERWKQETPLIKYNKKVFLITLDQNISEKKAKEIKSLGFIAFVQDNLKKEKFSSLDWIKSLNELPKELKRW